VLVDDDLKIIQFRGHTDPYLSHPEGEANFDVLKVVRRSLVVCVRQALAEARAAGSAVRKESIPFQHDGTRGSLSIEVVPIRGATSQVSSYLILFDDARQPRRRASAEGVRVPRGARLQAERIAELERELAPATKSCRARTKSWRPPKRSCSRRTKSCRR
jgi:two-component system, chemotaxis family, CheB/CheR fusion protein